MPAPCGVPIVVGSSAPSSTTPALSQRSQLVCPTRSLSILLMRAMALVDGLLGRYSR
jgi:hypothetical protein